MGNQIKLPAIALLGGVVGFGLRKVELATAFVAETGLHIEGSWSTYVLLMLSLAVAVGLFMCSPKGCNLAPGDYHGAFHIKQCKCYPVIGAVATFLVLVAGALLIFSWFMGQSSSMVALILGAACLVTVPFLYGIIQETRASRKKSGYFASLLAPAFTSCVWLVVVYQADAANPVRLDFVYGLLAIIALVLGWYQMAGFTFEKPKVKGMCVCSLLGVYLTMVALADSRSLWQYFLYVGMALFLLLHTVALLHNLEANDTDIKLDV